MDLAKKFQTLTNAKHYDNPRQTNNKFSFNITFQTDSTTINSQTKVFSSMESKLM